MKKIQMVDLLSQFRKIEPEVMKAIIDVIENTAFIKGPNVKEFASNLESYLNAGNVIPCGNGTDALQIALMATDLDPGDEVITTPFTFISTIEVIKLLGLKPVLADIDEKTFNLDPACLNDAITSRTRAIVPVHLFGQCADMESIIEIANRNELVLIEDTAQALGAEYIFKDGQQKKAGTLGQIGCTSFFPSKNLGAFGDGGAIFTPDDEMAEKLNAMVNHGMKKKYHYEYVGVNSRLDTLQAAILNIKLRHLDEYHRARQKAAGFYDENLSGIGEITIPYRAEHSNHIFHQYTIKVPAEKRDRLKDHLNKKNIPAMIYYPVGLHLQKAYSDLGYSRGDFPVTEKMTESVLSLPMHTELEEDQMEFICKSVKEFFKN